MIAFWIAAAVLSAAAAGLMLARGARALAAPGEDPALAVHRRQLAELDDLVGRGLLAEGERRAATAEAGRRLLAAADRGAEPASPTAGRRAALIAAAATPLLAMGVYFTVGAPGMADRPYAARLAEWRAADPASLDPPRMAAVLRAIAAEHPADPEPLKNLALAERLSGRPFEAAQALRKAVALAPGRADLWAGLGEAFVAQADGEVGADARAAFGEALRLDPGSEVARYYMARPSQMQDRIRGMVEGLAARLAQNPDDPEGWARLVRAYAVLGENAKRDAALARARGLYKARPDILKALDTAAEAPQ